MLGTHKLVVDEWAEVWDLLKPYADGSFWQLPELDPANVYIVGRVVLKDNWQTITDWATANPGRIVFSNPAEGSETVLLQLSRLRIADLVQDGRIGLLTSGNMAPGIRYCKTDSYFSNIVEYTENLEAAAHSVQVPAKPWDFVFLNGRLRPHRKALIDALRGRELLARALWTNLNSSVEMAWTSVLTTAQTEPIRLLPPEYEIPRAVPNLVTGQLANNGFVKHQLFNHTWGDAIINPRVYVDSCFSLVTETIFDYPHTFRTEKIWKPMIMQHPFVVAANSGYYRDLHSAGFRTFGHLIDESFDSVENSQDRIDRIVDVVADICYNGAEHFLEAAADVCKYNYQHLRKHNARERNLLPTNLQKYFDQ